MKLDMLRESTFLSQASNILIERKQERVWTSLQATLTVYRLKRIAWQEVKIYHLKGNAH